MLSRQLGPQVWGYGEAHGWRQSELVKRVHAHKRQPIATWGHGGSVGPECPIFKGIDIWVCTIKYPDFKMLTTNIKFARKHFISYQTISVDLSA